MSDMWNIFGTLTQFIVGISVISIVVEAITEILVTSSLLDIVYLRPWISKRALPPDGNYDNVKWYDTALYTLLTCGYCSSVWVSAGLVWFVPGGYFGLLPWDNVFIKIFLLHRISNQLHVWYELARRGRVNTIDLELKATELVKCIETAVERLTEEDDA